MTLSSWTSLGISHKPFLDGSMCHWRQGNSENLAYHFLFRYCNYLGDLFAQWLQFPLFNRPYLINSLNHVYKYDCRALFLMPNYSVSCWSLLQICCMLLNNGGNYTTGMSISCRIFFPFVLDGFFLSPTIKTNAKIYSVVKLVSIIQPFRWKHKGCSDAVIPAINILKTKCTLLAVHDFSQVENPCILKLLICMQFKMSNILSAFVSSQLAAFIIA